MRERETKDLELERKLNNRKQQNTVLELDVKTRQASLDFANEENEKYKRNEETNKNKYDLMKKENTTRFATGSTHSSSDFESG